jgi:hypothetical protein
MTLSAGIRHRRFWPGGPHDTTPDHRPIASQPALTLRALFPAATGEISVGIYNADLMLTPDGKAYAYNARGCSRTSTSSMR